MRSSWTACVSGAVLVLAIVAPSAMAQLYQPRPAGYGSPTVSPYINLTQRGVSPATAYYGVVRPEVRFQNNLAGLQQQLNQTNAQVAATDQALATLPETGHTVAFMNTAHYFGSLGGASPTRGVTPSTTAPAPRSGGRSTSSVSR
jgi:hypothetical protein